MKFEMIYNESKINNGMKQKLKQIYKTKHIITNVQSRSMKSSRCFWSCSSYFLSILYMSLVKGDISHSRFVSCVNSINKIINWDIKESECVCCLFQDSSVEGAGGVPRKSLSMGTIRAAFEASVPIHTHKPSNAGKDLFTCNPE